MPDYDGPAPFWGPVEDIGQSPGVDLELDPQTSKAAEPVTARDHDPRKQQDRTGLIMNAQSRPANQKKVNQERHRIIANGAITVCTRCKSETFRVFASSKDNHIQIVCADRECGAYFPILDVTPVQMNDRIAREHGIMSPILLGPNPSRGPRIYRN